ncbi:MAG: cell division protein ZapA [Desulfovibrio sp.]|jgi:cell division protein ZapA|nr:cell division protein ZapA [Desulfovibrio sp.]
MHSHVLEVLGLELSFRAEADPARIERARKLLEERFSRMGQHGGMLSKEKLFAFLALSLADDVLLLQRDKKETAGRIEEILGAIQKVAG